MARTPVEIGIGLFVIGVFASIYHPVGLAIVTAKWRNTGMRIAVNGVWGNLGVASAALLTGWMIDNAGWRAAFVLPGVVSIGAGSRLRAGVPRPAGRAYGEGGRAGAAKPPQPAPS